MTRAMHPRDVNSSLALVLLAFAAHAATIHGQVVETQSGKPLARALVVVQPVTGSKGATASLRTNPNGLFEFANLPAGSYIVSAAKTGFYPMEYGQKRWNTAGTPVVLADSDDFSMRLALPHFGAITGRVLDVNDVGIPNCTVWVYRNSEPPEVVEKAVTDDRGIYRLWGLLPGAYLVRSAQFEDDTGIFLPTFARQSLIVRDASTSDAVLDQDWLGADVRPISGRLFTVSGRVWNPAAQHASVVTLVSDMGSQQVTTGVDGRFTFEHIAPGAYELYAQGSDSRSRSLLMAYMPLEIDQDRAVTVDLAPLFSVQFSFLDTSGKPVDPTGLTLLLRRKELSGAGKQQYLALDDGNRARLDPGRWELALGPSASWYAARFTGPGPRTPTGPAAGWNEFVVAPGNSPPAVEFVLSPAPATLRGIVTAAGAASAGAPVYLEAFDPSSGRRVRDLRTARTDVHGQYLFAGLPPGAYRVVASFEFQTPDSAAFTRAQAREIRIDEGRQADADLELWTIE
jgi:hypothetical protein